MRRGLLTAILLIGVLCTPAKAAFSDVPAGAWYEADLKAMETDGLIAGFPDGTFRAGAAVSRGEFLTITARVLGLERPSAGGHWARDSAEAVRDQAGCWAVWSFSSYDAPITREEAAAVVMLSLLPQAEQGDWSATVAQIKDFSSIQGNYAYLVERAWANGLLRGYPDGTFRPTATLTRAEACALLARAVRQREGEAPAPEGEKPAAAPAVARRGGTSENGWLQVKDGRLCNEAGEPVALRGMSTHGLQWYGQFAGEGAIQAAADRGANVLRLAMYVGEGGYLSDPAGMTEALFAAADLAIAADLYVILDWHILNGDTANPRNHQTEAVAFFQAAAWRYADTPNVIYEICNEPNGGITWSGDVKPYAQAVTGTIRAISPKSLILVGSPTWSQEVDVAAADPLKEENVMYTCHFYAGTHGADLRAKISRALSLGAAVFVSEWGTSAASGDGGPYLEEAKVWLNFMEVNGLSWCNWSLCDKGEASAALVPGASPEGGWTDADLTASGKLVFDSF